MDGKGIAASLYGIVTKQKAFIAILVMLVGMFFSRSNFYSAYNLLDMLNSTSILLILSFGVTLTIIAGGCDLSIGGILVVSGILSIKLQDYMSMELAILCAIVFGVAVGFVNGFLVVLMSNCLNLLGVSTYLQVAVKGAILVLAIWLDNRKQA